MRSLIGLVCFLSLSSLLAEESAKGWFNRGSIAASSQKKIEAFQKVVALDPDYWGGWCYLGYAYSSEKNFVKAEEAFDKELEVHPNYYCALQGKAALRLEEQKWDDAIKLFDQVIKLQRDYRDAYMGRALAREAKGDVEGANADRLSAEKGPRVSRRQLLAGWGPLLALGIIFLLLGSWGFTRRPRIVTGAVYVWGFVFMFAAIFGPVWSDLPAFQRAFSAEDLGVLAFVSAITLFWFFVLRRIKSMVFVYNGDGAMIYRGLCASLKAQNVSFKEQPLSIECAEGLIRITDYGFGTSMGYFQFNKSNADFRRRIVAEFRTQVRDQRSQRYPTSAIFSVVIGLVLVLIALNEVLLSRS